MAKRAPKSSTEAGEEENERLVTSVDRLAFEVRVLREVLDEIREDFSWVTRNGPTARAIEHVHVKRMALDPCAEDWGEHLEIERSTYDPGSLRSKPPAIPVDADRVDELTTVLETIAQGQLEIILTALDGVRTDLLMAIKPSGGQSKLSSPPSSPEPIATPPLGKLF